VFDLTPSLVLRKLYGAESQRNIGYVNRTVSITVINSVALDEHRIQQIR